VNLVDLVAEMIPAADWWPPIDELGVFDDGQTIQVWWIGYLDGEDGPEYGSFVRLSYGLAEKTAWTADMAEMLSYSAGASRAAKEHGKDAEVTFKEGIGWVYDEELTEKCRQIYGESKK